MRRLFSGISFAPFMLATAAAALAMPSHELLPADRPTRYRSRRSQTKPRRRPNRLHISRRVRRRNRRAA